MMHGRHRTINAVSLGREIDPDSGSGERVKKKGKDLTKNMETECPRQGSPGGWTGDFFPHKTNVAQQMILRLRIDPRNLRTFIVFGRQGLEFGYIPQTKSNQIQRSQR